MEIAPQFPGGGRFRRLKPTLRQRFGERVHKLTLRGGFGCPNRDGRIGTGGCIFCSEVALLPAFKPAFGPIEAQLEAGLSWIASRHGTNKAIAYFQDGTATDAPIDVLEELYSRAVWHPQVVALSVGTRPDWIADDVLALLGSLARSKPIILELGLQLASDILLKACNRGHSVQQFERAVGRAHGAGLEVIAHAILDLPGATARDRSETASCLNRNRVDGVKIHNLHVLDRTPLASRYRAGEVPLTGLRAYAGMVADFLESLDPRIVIHRLTGEGPPDLMLAPEWGRDKKRVLATIEHTLEERSTWQGKRCESHDSGY